MVWYTILTGREHAFQGPNFTETHPYIMNTKIAETIHLQLRRMDKWIFAHWGAKNYRNTGKGLSFKTSGCVKKKCTVHIVLDEGSDLYNITFSRVRKLTYIVDKQVDGVFVDQLIEIIDRWVMKGE